ncbi:MAG: carbamoyltransferase HypF [Anaerolineales bacterium]|jgi:hydrogenase maturation protein HypF
MGEDAGVQGASIRVGGVVQGVGFRPFVYALAKRLQLAGWVRNTSAGVEIEIDGSASRLEDFVRDLRLLAPPLARIDDLRVDPRPANGYKEFAILASERIPQAFQPVSPDVGLCPDCLSELFDAQNRRYRYPFINCTNCGPRFTIIEDVPYDRPNTTMAPFAMCPECAAEYEDPGDRRFHAQPIACPTCGPHIWLEEKGQLVAQREQALQMARTYLAEGRILAIRGLGGFHLACDATRSEPVAELRRRKLRVDKPFALMVWNLAAAQSISDIGPQEAGWIQGQERPILLLPRKEGASIAREVAPGQRTLGVMLPYTPLHYLLLEPAEKYPPALVMTSGNLSEEPIAINLEEARQRLAGVADAFLMHDRGIRTRCDDSVVRAFPGWRPAGGSQDGQSVLLPLRRSRGFAPFPVKLPWDSPTVLAVGGELKNTFCLTRADYAFMSQHIGDLENYETLRSFAAGIEHYERLFHVQPTAMACDLHPDYLATRYAEERAARESLPLARVQHHHAHIAACMAEHGEEGSRPLIGVAFDGTGYGLDGTIWGGEFLIADYEGFERALYLEPIPLLGGDAAVREPYRLALAWLWRSGQEWSPDLAPVQHVAVERRRALRQVLEATGVPRPDGLNAPLTSSMGRLFDAFASLVGVRQVVNYEAQAAMELEALCDPDEQGFYPFEYHGQIITPLPLFGQAVEDVRSGTKPGRMASRFHNGVARMVTDVCERLSQERGIGKVALSGGVWQNQFLLTRTVELLEARGLEVLLHKKVPSNDGGIALGQAAIAVHRLLGYGRNVAA